MGKQIIIARLSRAALMVLGLTAASLVLGTIPFIDTAVASNAGGNGGGHGGGNGGGHGGNGGGHGGGHGGGNSGGNGGNGGGHSANHTSGGTGHGAIQGDVENKKAKAVADAEDQSLSPSGLGKLNGVMHASPQALAHASTNSPIGRIGQTFRDALREFSAAKATASANPNAPAPTTQDLGGILAGATNKTVTGAQVQAIADRLAEVNNDPSIGDISDEEAKDIADAANAAKAGEEASTN